MSHDVKLSDGHPTNDTPEHESWCEIQFDAPCSCGAEESTTHSFVRVRGGVKVFWRGPMPDGAWATVSKDEGWEFYKSLYVLAERYNLDVGELDACRAMMEARVQPAPGAGEARTDETLFCVWCGANVPWTPANQPDAIEVLREHSATCSEHPAVKELARLRAAPVRSEAGDREAKVGDSLTDDVSSGIARIRADSRYDADPVVLRLCQDAETLRQDVLRLRALAASRDGEREVTGFAETFSVEIRNQRDHYAASLLTMGGTLVRVGKAPTPHEALAEALRAATSDGGTR